MKNIDTRTTYLAGFRYVLLPSLVILLLMACMRQETAAPPQAKDITFQAEKQAIVTAANGYALRFQEDGNIYMQTPNDIEDWKFRIGGAEQSAIKVDDWSENELWYRNVYPDIDLRFYDEGNGNAGYDFMVKAGGAPEQICLALEGKQTPRLSATGELILPTEKGEIRHSTPFAYQEIKGKKQVVTSKFTLNDGCLGFELGDYDKNYDLVIN